MTLCLFYVASCFQAEIKANLAGLKQDCESLKSKIVQSPERFKGVCTEQTCRSRNPTSLKGKKSFNIIMYLALQVSFLAFI